MAHTSSTTTGIIVADRPESPRRAKRGLRRIVVALTTLAIAMTGLVVNTVPANAAWFTTPTLFCSVATATVDHGIKGDGYYRIWWYRWNGRAWEWAASREGRVYATVVGGDQGRITFNGQYGEYYIAYIWRWDLQNGSWVYKGGQWTQPVNIFGWATGTYYCQATA